MTSVPPLFTISFAIIGALFGAVSVYAILKRGDISFYRLIHSVPHINNTDINYKWVRRNGLATIIYIVPSQLKGRLILSMPHMVQNPGRAPIKDVSLVINYPARFGLSDDSPFGGTRTGPSAAEYNKRRQCSLDITAAQVLIHHTIIRSGESVTIDDSMIVYSSSIELSSNDIPNDLKQKLKNIPGFKDYATLHMSIFSEKTRARSFSIDLIIANGEKDEYESSVEVDPEKFVQVFKERYVSKPDFDKLAGAMLEVAGGNLIPPGLYRKAPFPHPAPLKQEIAFVVAPTFQEIESEGIPTYVSDFSESYFGSFLYWTTVVDYKSIPNGLSAKEVERYLGISRVDSKYFYSKPMRYLGSLLRQPKKK